MFGNCFFTGTYDLYRPTVSTAGTGAQTIAEPGAATASAQPCLVFAAGRQPFRLGPSGADVEHDKVMYVPVAADLLPEGRGDAPDRVKIDGLMYTVRRVWAAAQGQRFKVALLAERR